LAMLEAVPAIAQPRSSTATPNAVGNLQDEPPRQSEFAQAFSPPDAAPFPPGLRDTAPAMTLAALEDIAQRNNPTLSQAAARVQAAQAQCLQVGLYPNPVLGYKGIEIGNEGRAGQQGGFFSQEIVTAGKLGLNQEVAAQEVQQAQWAFDIQRRRVLTDVRRGYFEVLFAQRTVGLSDQLVQVGRQGVTAAESLKKAQEVGRADVLQARIEAESANVQSERAKNRHVAAWRSLAAVLGTPDMPPASLAGDLQDGIAQLTWESSLQRLLAESPAIGNAKAGVARAQAAVSRECAGRIPNVDLEAGVQYDNATQNTIAEVQVGLPIPLFNRNQGNISRAQAELIAAQHEVRRVELELQQRLSAAFEQYASARYQVEKYTRDILPNAKASLDLTTAGYRQGEFGYLLLLTAQRTYFQTNLAYLEALRELRSASAAIEGSLLSDSLRAEGASP
jgi:outer membrane protein, heavy metal efflux system